MSNQMKNNLLSTLNSVSVYISNYLPNAIQFLIDTKDLSFWSTLIKLPKSIVLLNFILLFIDIIRLVIIAIVCWYPPEKLGFIAHYLDYDVIANIFVQLGLLEPFSCIAFIIILSMEAYFNYMTRFSRKCETWKYAYDMTILNQKSFSNCQKLNMTSKQSLNVNKLPNFPNLPEEVRFKVLLNSIKMKQLHVIFTILFGLLNFVTNA